MLFLDRQESHHDICIVMGKASIQCLDGFFLCSNKSLGISDYCSRETIVRVLE